MIGKRGQGLSTNAIVLIVLGVIVLVILIMGFTIGWKRILPFVASNNIENIKTSCTLACSTGNVYDFCSQPRTLKADDISGDQGDGTCQSFSDSEGRFTIYGIGACPSINCPTQ